MKSSIRFIAFCFGLADLISATPDLKENGHSFKRQANTTACATGVHMIVARASTEAPGEGIIGAVATQVQQSVPGSDSEAVDYPATLTNYTSSEASGVAAMQKLIQDYVTKCPSSKIALLGYSQGAQVAGDVMCGTSEAGFTTTQPLSGNLSNNIVAVIQMGDPSHVPGQPQDVGTSKNNGVFPRVNTAACAPSANITQSYCNTDDEFCDSGTSLQVHLSYVSVFGTQAAQFIMGRVNGTIARQPAGGAIPFTGDGSVMEPNRGNLWFGGLATLMLAYTYYFGW